MLLHAPTAANPLLPVTAAPVVMNIQQQQ